jgi:hypothetical protein
MKKLMVTILALAGSLGLGTQASADQLGYPSGKPFRAIEHDFQHVREDIENLSVDLSGLEGDITMIKDDVSQVKDDVTMIKDDITQIESDVTMIKSDVEALALTLTVEVAVNTQICSKGAAQCANFDPEDAVDGNNSLVQLFASVSQGGLPVDGLTFDDFFFSGPFVPPGGAVTALCEQADCGGSFFLGGNGLYMMFLKPSGDWDDGRYAGTLSVEDPAGGSGLALVTVDIPAAP